MRSDFLVYEAKSFYNAYIALEQLSKADTTPELLLYAPMIVNGSFSIAQHWRCLDRKQNIYKLEHYLPLAGEERQSHLLCQTGTGNTA